MKEDKLISKSEYTHSQLGSFISAKQYMVYRYQDHKCLLVRFANESEYAFDSFEFNLVQLDTKGTIIKETAVKCEQISFAAGSMYAMDKGIVIEDKCVDCRIYITCARSGRYLYRVSQNRRISVHYLTDDKWKYIQKTPKHLRLKRNKQGFAAGKKDMHSYGWIKFIAVIAVIALICINALPYVEYFIYGDLSEGAGSISVNHSEVASAYVQEEIISISGEDYAEI